MTKERNLPDDAPDDRLRYSNSVEDLIGHPAGPSILQELHDAKREATVSNLENRLLRDRYSLHGEEDSRDALIRDEVENEVQRIQEWAGTSEEVEDIYRQSILRDWQNPQGKSDDSISAFTKPQRDRLRREYEKFYPPDEEE